MNNTHSEVVGLGKSNVHSNNNKGPKYKNLKDSRFVDLLKFIKPIPLEDRKRLTIDVLALKLFEEFMRDYDESEVVNEYE